MEFNEVAVFPAALKKTLQTASLLPDMHHQSLSDQYYLLLL